MIVIPVAGIQLLMSAVSIEANTSILYYIPKNETVQINSLVRLTTLLLRAMEKLGVR